MADNINDGITPYRIQMIFTGAHKDVEVLREIYDAVVLEAEQRGIFFEWGGITPMDVEDVIPGSDLHKVLLGPGRRPPHTRDDDE